jgi:hypothetical protein
MKASPSMLLSVLRISAILLAIAATSPALWASDRVISVAGNWRFRLDRADAGIRDGWFQKTLPEKARLPGVLAAQGIGDPVSLDTKWTGGIQDPDWFKNPLYAPWTKPENFKFPFWLQPDKYYAGAAWYQRDVEIPAGWASKRVTLVLERPHWQTRVWLDGKELGLNNSLSTPHRYDLGTGLTIGRHVLTVRVDNSRIVDVGENSHCITDHTQGNWNGVAGAVHLEATAPLWIEDLQVYPELTTGRVVVRGSIGNTTGKAGTAKLALQIESVHRGKGSIPVTAPELELPVPAAGGTFETTLVVPQPRAWDEFTPELYRLRAGLNRGADKREIRFGFRDLGTQGTEFMLNGHRIFFRGTLECCIFPLTGHPPTVTSEWVRVIKVAKAHGLNMFRFHSYCPPEAAFIAADQLGFYFQVETCWANQSTTIGDGKPVDQWVYDETDRILKEYGNHPSFMLMPYGNEPGGDRANAYLAKYVTHFKAEDPRRLWTSGAGWPQLEENQFHLSPDPRIQGWGQGLKSRINGLPPETTTDYRDYIQKRKVPVISHEIGEWCVYPNFDEISKYKGYLKPKNFEIFRDSLNAHHMGDLAHQFLLASGKLQTLCYKEDIEAALRTPGMGGFHLLDLHDFPGQGTALVGVLDPLWEGKGYVTAGEYRRFAGSVVPLARLKKRVLTTNESLAADVEVANFGPAPLQSTPLHWRILDQRGRVVSKGKLPAADIAIGNGVPLGSIALPLAGMAAPAQYKLELFLPQALGGNDWDFWVYPQVVSVQPPAGVTISDRLDQQTIDLLNKGGRVLLTVSPDQVKGDATGKVALGFSSIFWNTAWTQRQPPHTLGILCDPKNPALAQFPTEYHSNWQWWYIVSRAGAMILDDLPKDLRPTIQVIDDWFTNRKLGIAFEARVGKGRLMVCSVDLRREAEQNPVARQLLASLLHYASGDRFDPKVRLTAEQVRGVFDVAQTEKPAPK